MAGLKVEGVKKEAGLESRRVRADQASRYDG